MRMSLEIQQRGRELAQIPEFDQSIITTRHHRHGTIGVIINIADVSYTSKTLWKAKISTYDKIRK